MTAHHSVADELAERNIRKWIHAKHVQDRVADPTGHETIGPYVTVAREIGSGGGQIARMAGDRLGWDVLDGEIVDYLAERYGTPRNLVEIADERHIGWIEEMLTGWMGGKQWTSARYVHRLHHLLMLAAQHGNVIVVGRGARFILPPKHGLSVRIVAPAEFRARRIAKERGIDHKAAQAAIAAADREQAAYIKEHFHHAVDDSHMYDLVINVEKLRLEEAADLIVDAVRSHGPMMPTAAAMSAAAL